MSKQYKAAMIVVGNEILSGRTQDKNINYVANALLVQGVALVEVRIIPDIEGEIIDAIHALREKVDYVFTSGGIGPTHDDITAESVAKAFGVVLEKNAQAYGILLEHYGKDEFTKARQKMAMIPVGAKLIPNPVSAAPGFVLGNVYVMAGVPRILQAMVDHVVPGLKGGAPILSRTIGSVLPESVLAEGLGKLQSRYDSVNIGSYPRFKNGSTSVNVVLRSTDEAKLEKAAHDVERLIIDLEASSIH